jgi:hypothetical protein
MQNQKTARFPGPAASECAKILEFWNVESSFFSRSKIPNFDAGSVGHPGAQNRSPSVKPVAFEKNAAILNRKLVAFDK